MRNNLTKLPLFVDERGWLTEVMKSTSTQPIEQIHFSVSKPGAVRGNHYHKQRVERLLLTSGTGKLVLEDNETKERSEATLSGESPVLVEIPPNVSHKIEN
jgi:UDP-2-acetamido-2,6-beta-L-arabino-hexul-4-ose reductase